MTFDDGAVGCTFACVRLCGSILLTALVLSLSPAAGGPGAPAVELVRERGAQEDRLIAVNRSIFPISAVVHVSALESATVVDGVDAPRTVPPSSELLLARVVSADPETAWSYEHDFRWYAGAMEAKHAAQVVYQLPYTEGEAHRVLQGFNGEFSHTDRFAIDWAMPIGTRIMAARAGIVILVVDKHPSGGADPSHLGLANKIWILHDDGTVGVYAHMVADGARVVPGQEVESGDRIGRSGNSGLSSRPHLHFEVRAGSKGEKSRTFPIVFNAARSPIAVPIADISYMRPLASGKVPRVPSNLIGGLDFLSHPARSADDEGTDSFRSNDRIAVRIKIGAPARYELRVEFYRDDSQQPSVVRTLRTEHDQGNGSGQTRPQRSPPIRAVAGKFV